LLEEQCRTAGAQYAIADLRHLEARVDGERNALQCAGVLELAEEVAKIFVFHGGTPELKPRHPLVKRESA
jgi:hypothetical protein